MDLFPRTEIGGVSVSRLIIGTNWFLGFSHWSQAKDRMIKERQGRKQIADVIEAFVQEGCDTLLGTRPDCIITDAVAEAEQRTGRKITTLGTPHLPVSTEPPDWDGIAQELDRFAQIGVRFCMPHQATTDALLDRRTRTILHMARVARMIRERGMLPGLSTHMPETVVYADESDLDVETYIQIYNAAGFLMQLEADWVYRIIHRAQKPVITIKPMAAGRLLPLVGLAFVWSTIREMDAVCAGCYTADEAKEVVEISRAIIERRPAFVDLQQTRSKESVVPACKRV